MGNVYSKLLFPAIIFILQIEPISLKASKKLWAKLFWKSRNILCVTSAKIALNGDARLRLLTLLAGAPPRCFPVNFLNFVNLNILRPEADQNNKVSTSLKKRLWHRCFPVNFAKFQITPLLKNASGRLLLYDTLEQMDKVTH